MAGAESHLTRSLLAAARGRWDDVDWERTKPEIRRYRDGSDAEPGSDNHPILAYCIALIVAWKRPDLLHRLGITRDEVIAWWERELTVRLRKGLQLTEPRARIYVEWEAALICWCYSAFHRFAALQALHLRYVRATAAMMALCAYPVRPRRHSPPDVDSKMYRAALYVSLGGSRSWSGEREDGKRRMHHLGQSGWEVLLSGIMDITVPDEFRWHRDLIAVLTPGWMGLSQSEVGIIRAAVNNGATETVDDLVGWLDGVGTLWPCRLVRFERGAACIGLGREVNGNTRAIDTLAIHQDGTMHILASEGINRNANMEPCGVNEFEDGNHLVEYRCWRGGEDDPRRMLVLHPERWGAVRWDVHLHRDGHHVVRRPGRPVPIPPPNPPEPPEGSPRRKSDWVRYRYYVLAAALVGALIWWGQCS